MRPPAVFPGRVRALPADDQRLDPFEAVVVTGWFDQAVESFIEVDARGRMVRDESASPALPPVAGEIRVRWKLVLENTSTWDDTGMSRASSTAGR